MQLLRPVAGSAKRVYVARSGKQGTPVALSSSMGEGVQFVEEPGLADQVVAIHVGANRVDRATAKRLQKACLDEQRRQERGKKDKGVFDQILADLEARPAKRKKKASDGGFSFAAALVLSGVVWAGLCLYVAREENVGIAFISLLLGVAMVPLLAIVLKFFDVFMPSGLMAFGALGLCVLVWAAAIGVIDVKPRHHRNRHQAAVRDEDAETGSSGGSPAHFSAGTEESGVPEHRPPSGTIAASSLGSLRIGMTVEDVRRLVTAPDAEQTVNFGGGPTPEFDWTWHFDDGDVTLAFDNAKGELAEFVATTRAVATTSGLRVGDSFAPIQRRYGDQLRTSPIGAGLRILSEGRPGTYPALLFVVRGGIVESIVGGLPKPAGE